MIASITVLNMNTIPIKDLKYKDSLEKVTLHTPIVSQIEMFRVCMSFEQFEVPAVFLVRNL